MLGLKATRGLLILKPTACAYSRLIMRVHGPDPFKLQQSFFLMLFVAVYMSNSCLM